MPDAIQADLFSPPQAVRNIPRIEIVQPSAVAAIEALNRTGAYINAKGQVVLAKPAEWTRKPPNRAGYWLLSDGVTVTVHRAIQLPRELVVLGIALRLEEGANFFQSLENRGWDWFGPMPEPPDRKAP
jgi:hypothetical protein